MFPRRQLESASINIWKNDTMSWLHLIERFQNVCVPDCNIHKVQWRCIVSDKEKTDCCVVFLLSTQVCFFFPWTQTSKMR